MVEASPPAKRFHWITRHIPTRETIHQYRLLRPFAPYLSRGSLWRMNRRSVPRGVAIGLFVAVIIPFMHTFIAALLAIPTRANVFVAALFTLAVNPLTIPLMYFAAFRIGSWELHHDASLLNPADAERYSSELSRMLFWVHHASGSIAVGILTLATSIALVGYFTSALAWRLWRASRWRHRHHGKVSPLQDLG